MNIITTASIQIFLNGEILDAFSPQRGLRQGDPFSLYLFVLRMETLSSRINRYVLEKQWQPIRIVNKGQPMSHIFFVDYLLLFGETTYSQARVMKHVLQQFYGDSGQWVSTNKSRVWFAPSTPTYLRGTIYLAFGIKTTINLGMYLSVPLIHRRITKATYMPLLSKIRDRLSK